MGKESAGPRWSVADPLWRHYACAAILATSVILSSLRWLLYPSDPFHCNALLSDGQWIDRKYKNWQPEGCMLHSYHNQDISTCLSSKRVVFIGDSVTRNLFFVAIHMSDSSLPAQTPDDDRKHVDYHYKTASGVEFAFIWDPYLNNSQTDAILDIRSSTEDKPYIVAFGTGLWYLRYSQSSGGLTAWESKVESVLGRVAANREHIATHIAFFPVEDLVPSKLHPDRASAMKPSDIDAMNADLKHRINPASVPFDRFGFPRLLGSPSSLPVDFPLVFNDVLHTSQTSDGLHYSQAVLEAQANILYNRYCNEHLPKTPPLGKTCCRSYPTPNWIQVSCLLFFILAPVITTLRFFKSIPPALDKSLPSPSHLFALAVFGMAVILMFVADRTHVFLKEQKQFEPTTFTLLCLCVFAVGIVTLKRVDKDQPFLHREQTDEWKGWMQLIILVYHFLGASKISGIYNPIRVLVASYLFMTGYGHCSFYMKKADYGFLRVAQVLVRLNLLTIALAYTMGTFYFDYYFSPMVSFWFLVIYGTMRIGSTLNDRALFIVVKVVASCGMITFLLNSPWLFDPAMSALKQYGNIRWSPKEVKFRLNLDVWIVYVGMLCAVAVSKLKETRLSEQMYWPRLKGVILGSSALSLLWYMYFELSQESKFTYNAWHPYISAIPILAFISLRNANLALRSITSDAFAFVGTCSLETFIIQFHFWLAADTKGILLVIPGTSLRPVSFVASTIGFIWLSHRVAIATGHLTDWICGTTKRTAPNLPTHATVVDATEMQESNRAIASSQPAATSDHSAATTHSAGPGAWADRLATGSSQPGFRMVDSGSWISQWVSGLKKRFLIFSILLWTLNMLWPLP